MDVPPEMRLRDGDLLFSRSGTLGRALLYGRDQRYLANRLTVTRQLPYAAGAAKTLDAQARANPLENFRLVFNDRFIKSIVERMDDNADIFGKILDDQVFQTVVMEHYLKRVYGQARAGSEPDATSPGPPI